MGNKMGGEFVPEMLQKLQEKAKQVLQEGAAETARHVFISFAHEDFNLVNMLRGQARNENTDINFDDHSLKKPFDSNDANYIKQGITDKIGRASVTVVFLTEHSAQSRWVNWEIEESIRQGKGVIGVYRGSSAPTDLPTAFRVNNCTAVPWTHEGLARAIEQASRNR